VSTDVRFDRGWRSLTSEYVRARLERLDEMLAEAESEGRIKYLSEQREWWSNQLPICYRREGLIRA
jgi:hypothetical protein